MKTNKIKTIKFKRKRQGKTNYKKRLKLLLSETPRLVVRKSLKNISMQIIEYRPKGDVVIASAHSSELKKMGWNLSQGNIPAAYLTGYLIGKRSHTKKIQKAILDTGFHTSTKGNRIYAALKGAVDAKLNIPHSDDQLPTEERINGNHIQSNKDNQLQQMFNLTKKKIDGENGEKN